MKKLVLFSVAALLCLAAFAETDYTVGRDVFLLKSDMEAAQADITNLQAGATIALASNKLFIGSYDGVATARTLTGDISITPSGAVSIASGVVSNADLATNASIAASKLSAAVQASLALADSAYQAQSSPTFDDVVAEEDVTLDSTNAVWRKFKVSDDYEVFFAPMAYGTATVTNGYEIPAVSAYVTLASSADITCTVSVADFALGGKGQVMNLINIGATTITIADSGTFKTPAAAVIPADGALSLYSADGTNWWQVGKSID